MPNSDQKVNKIPDITKVVRMGDHIVIQWLAPSGEILSTISLTKFHAVWLADKVMAAASERERGYV